MCMCTNILATGEESHFPDDTHSYAQQMCIDMIYVYTSIIIMGKNFVRVKIHLATYVTDYLLAPEQAVASETSKIMIRSILF